MPILQFTSFKFKNLINLALKYVLQSCIMWDLILNKIKHPIASGGLHPPDPLLQRYITRVNSSLLDTPRPDSHYPSENPGSALWIEISHFGNLQHKLTLLFNMLILGVFLQLQNDDYPCSSKNEPSLYFEKILNIYAWYHAITSHTHA